MSNAPLSDTTTPLIEVDFFRDEDAPGIARLFQIVYGDGYPIRIYYQPERLIEENASGRIISSVARTPTGEVVGHDALILLDPLTRLYENAAGAVLPGFRGHRIFPRLFKHSIVDTSKQFGVEELIGEPVCSHVHLQKMCLALDFKESGLEVDLMPAAAYTTEPATARRVSVLLGYFMHKHRTLTVQLPQIYRDELAYLYGGLDMERTFEYPQSALPTEGNTQVHINLFEMAQVARTWIDCIGPDFDSTMTCQEGEMREKGIEVFQVWVPLTSPFSPAATDILRQHGYFLGGLLPCWPNGDGLLMQKVSKEPDWEGLDLYSKRAKTIGKMIKRDWERAKAE